MAGKLIVKLEQRTFHFIWCNRTETDQVCRSCRAIVTGDTCVHCERIAQHKAERLRKFLASRAEEN